MIAGLEEITGGELYIGDNLVNDVPPKDRDIAMVFQNYALYPHMTVYKNMAFGLTLRKVPKAEIDRKVKEAAKILDIEGLLQRKPKALPAARGSAWRWAAPWCETRPCSCWTNRSPTWTRSCATPCARKSRCCISASAPHSYTSRTTRPRP